MTKQEKSYQIVEIFSRIKTAYNLRNERTAVAEFLGVSATTIDAWKQRNSIGDWDVILLKCPNINLNWLVFGEGEPFYTPDESAKTLSAIRALVCPPSE